MKLQKKFGLFLLVSALLSTYPTELYAASFAGKICKTELATLNSGGVTYKCVRVKGKLIWDKGTKINSIQTPSSPSPTSSVTSNAAPLAKPPIKSSYIVGDVGPAGGVIFYASPSQEDWGRYLEAFPKNALTENQIGSLCPTGFFPGDFQAFATNRKIGAGKANTTSLSKFCPNGIAPRILNLTFGGFTDWFIPSADELSELGTQIPEFSSISRQLWSSSNCAQVGCKTETNLDNKTVFVHSYQCILAINVCGPLATYSKLLVIPVRSFSTAGISPSASGVSSTPKNSFANVPSGKPFVSNAQLPKPGVLINLDSYDQVILQGVTEILLTWTIDGIESTQSVPIREPGKDVSSQGSLISFPTFGILDKVVSKSSNVSVQAQYKNSIGLGAKTTLLKLQ